MLGQPYSCLKSKISDFMYMDMYLVVSNVTHIMLSQNTIQGE